MEPGPQAKRRRCDSNAQKEPTNGAPMDVQQLKPHETIWFNDGNIVLATDVHLYRVHKGVLEKNSSVFRDMLGIPTGEAEGEANGASGDRWNGLPVVRMVDDSDGSIYNLLMTLYDREFYRGSEQAVFPVVLSLLHLSTKYDFSAIRREVINQLKRYYPSNLDEWDLSTAGSYMKEEPKDGDFQLLAAALQYDVRVILPVLYYQCAYQDWTNIFEFSSGKLSSEVLRRVVVGHSKLSKYSCKLGAQALFPDQLCPSQLCSEARAILLRRWLDNDSQEDPVFSLTKEGTERLGDEDLVDDFCPACREKSKDAMEELRVEVWENLPGIFGLDNWEKLKSEGV